MKNNEKNPINTELKDIALELAFKELLGLIIFKKVNTLKKAIIEALDITKDQFETIIRKDSDRFSTQLVKGSKGSIFKENIFCDKKYLITIEVKVTDSDDERTVIENLIYKEEVIPELTQLPIEEDKSGEIVRTNIK
jgi:hypothetical protein